MLRLYNSLSKKIEDFVPLNLPKVGMYTCGLTVYDYTHIGHIKKYIGDDILKRTLTANGFDVKHVMNVTDVGHLTSDADEGDDKLEKGAKEKGQTVWEVAKFYTNYFLESLKKANVILPDILAPATEHIKEQISLIQKLEKKGYIYQTEEALYFDISKFPEYGKLTGQKLEDKTIGSRDEVKVDPKKRNPQDFALWFFTVGHFVSHTMHWNSPWGDGFPGWHIECSAMSMEYLGDSFDIHTGGIDHIPVHHTNEIAQSEAATGQLFVKYWVHHNFLNIHEEKMSKSKKNFYTLDNLSEKGFDAIDLRYLVLTAKYRDELNFTWESLQAAQNALNNLREEVRDWEETAEDVGEYYQKFLEALNNDLNTPQAVAILWNMVKDKDYPETQKTKDLLEMDKVLGLKLDEYISQKIEIPEEVQKLVDQREKARAEKDFQKSDEIRDEIKKLGFEVKDTSSGPKVVKV